MTRVAVSPIPGVRRGASPGRLAVGGHRAAAAVAPATGTRWCRSYRRRLIVTDAVVIATAAFAPIAAIAAARGILPASPPLWISASLVTVVWLLALAVWRTRETRVLGVGATEYKTLAGASATTFGLLAAVFLAADFEGIRTSFISTMVGGTVALMLSRWLWRHWLTQQRQYGHYLSKVIVAGAPDEVRYIVDRLEKRTGAAYRVVGVALDEPSTGTLATDTGEVPVVCGLDTVTETVQRVGADTVIVTDHTERGGTYLRDLGWKLEGTSAELVVASSLTNVAGPRIHLRPVEGLPLMHVELPQFEGGKHVLKRVFDATAAGLALLLLMPLLVMVGIAIRLDSKGPALFRQERVGRGGTTFMMLKFRTMVPDAESMLDGLGSGDSNGMLFKLRDDPRVTRLGKLLRRTSIDELPQLWNVLTGEMSLVGPRPPLPREVNQYEPHVHRRLYIKPGLTGMWQINGRSDLSWQESVRLDLYYVENWSLTTDLLILWRTLKVFVRPDGAY
ncbi:sugar transferase [Ruicaihuangia caeni]|uniref:sugar transferase n=1 Tax=Ruicaihuangia caeni TaxID=3042517 RepID=UPI00338E0435